jgi:hypothetical protein
MMSLPLLFYFDDEGALASACAAWRLLFPNRTNGIDRPFHRLYRAEERVLVNTPPQVQFP